MSARFEPEALADDPRLAIIAPWLDQALNTSHWRLRPASADASFRRYFRIHCEQTDGGSRSLVLMDAPPEKETLGPWLSIAQRLRGAGLHAPEIIASNEAVGTVLMEDLGDRWLLNALENASADEAEVDRWYEQSTDALWRLQTTVESAGLPAYDEARLVAELELFPKWFLQEHLGYTPKCDEWEEIERVFMLLVEQALQQPKVFVHRDYHSRNILVTPGGALGIIDFQDAVLGPLTYDLVSLLKDCYIRWPAARVDAWMAAYHARCHAEGIVQCDRHTFRRWFDLMGLQRHLKVLGIFCRLWYRDGKAGYLNDLPLVLEYVLESAERYGATLNFSRWLRQLTAGIDLRQPGAGTKTEAGTDSACGR